jgi:hypothetical protein
MASTPNSYTLEDALLLKQALSAAVLKGAAHTSEALPAVQLFAMLRDAEALFKVEPPLVELSISNSLTADCEVYVWGDTHGHYPGEFRVPEVELNGAGDSLGSEKPAVPDLGRSPTQQF